MNRSALQRKTPLKAPRRRKCRHCRGWFHPPSSMAVACSVPCAKQVAKADAAKQFREQNQRDKQRLKSRSDVLKEAQSAFNAWIRMRDFYEPCISCGRSPNDGVLLTGSYWHASHYRSVGACSYLRFDEDNVHASCSACNTHKSGNIIEYRIALRQKIGDARLERLETAPKHYRWTKEQAEEIRDRYRRRYKERKKEIRDG